MANIGAKEFSDNTFAYMKRVLGNKIGYQEKRTITDENMYNNFLVRLILIQISLMKKVVDLEK